MSSIYIYVVHHLALVHTTHFQCIHRQQLFSMTIRIYTSTEKHKTATELEFKNATQVPSCGLINEQFAFTIRKYLHWETEKKTSSLDSWNWYFLSCRCVVDKYLLNKNTTLVLFLLSIGQKYWQYSIDFYDDLHRFFFV